MTNPTVAFAELPALSELEEQVLISLLLIEIHKVPSDLEAVERVHAREFGGGSLGCGGATEMLSNHGLIRRAGTSLSLTESGRERAGRMAKVRDAQGFSDVLSRCEQSMTYARFCERVYGRNLCQFNMLCMSQLDHMVEALALSEGHRVLDLGCGVGKLSEYLCDQSGAHVTGCDFAPVPIERAILRTASRRDRLAFCVADMDNLPFPEGAFDTIVSVDTLYFSADLDAVIARLYHLLSPGGQMGVFFTEMLESPPSAVRRPPPDTQLGRLLCKHDFAFHARDFTAEELAHWERSRRIAEELQADFEQEGNGDLCAHRIEEAEAILRTVKAGQIWRYFYHARRPD